MDRRSFLAGCGAAGLLPHVSTAQTNPDPATPLSGRRRIELNGEWRRFVDGELVDVIQIPSSLHPSGVYSLKREFFLTAAPPHGRTFLKFEAITYWGKAVVNGTVLGEMGPYVPYEFDCSHCVLPGRNEIEVTLADLTPTEDGKGTPEIAMGVNPGWEAYGGIIRDVCLEIRPAVFVENVKLAYNLDSGYQRAACCATVFLSGTRSSKVTLSITLTKEGLFLPPSTTSIDLQPGRQTAELRWDVPMPELWSPDAPHLYELVCTLHSEADTDTWNCLTGFRELVAQGTQFVLNGKPLVLAGVCRHDMWKGQGFTLTRAQQEQDMQMIKALGCNFVRLVHYPHDRNIVALADRLGLLVTEEPGYWIMDFRTMPRPEIELGFDILEKTIERDWNSPSVFAWLLSNECRLTVEVLREGKERCNRIDPLKRFVSAACDRPKEESKPIFEQAGMDFYDQHPYTFDMERFEHEADFFGGSRPLTFTEWGGKAVGQSQAVMTMTVDRLLDLADKRKLAGHSFWSWQDVRQYSRIDPEMDNGILQSGVVTEDREPRVEVYMELQRLMARRRHPHKTGEAAPVRLPPRSLAWSGSSKFTPVALDDRIVGVDGRKAWMQLEEAMQKFWPKNSRTADQWSRSGGQFRWWASHYTADFSLAALPLKFSDVDGYVRPLMVNSAARAAIPMRETCNRLHIVGQVALPDGYPLQKKHGEVCARYALYEAGGKVTIVPLRWGYEVVRANQIYEGTRIDSIAINAQPILEFSKDFAREVYRILLYSRTMERTATITRMECEVLDPEMHLAIFALTAERISTV